MKVSALPSDFKPTSRFARPAHIKADTHHLYTSEKYVVEMVYHSSMFYAPDFYSISVKDKLGNEIWNGGKAYFLDSLFQTDFVSDEFNRMILTLVNSTESSDHMQIVLIDLKTGKEEVLTDEGCYNSAGHFISFDGIYYADKNGVHCIDYGNNKQYLLHDVLSKSFTKIITWGSCAIKDCILVITGEEENNVCLFNLHQQELIDSTTLIWGKADSVSLCVGYVVQKLDTTISASYSDRQANGVLKHRLTEHYNLAFQ